MNTLLLEVICASGDSAGNVVVHRTETPCAVSKFSGLPWVMFLGYSTLPDQISEIYLADTTSPTNIAQHTTKGHG